MRKVLIVFIVVIIVLVSFIVLFGFPSINTSIPILNPTPHSSISGKQVVDVNVPYIDALHWQCRYWINSTHVVYRCWGDQYWEARLEDGTVVNPAELRKQGIRVPLRINYSITEVADLVNRRAWVIEEAGTEVAGLQHYRKVIENTTFEYKWVSIGEIYGGGVWELEYVGNKTFKAYLAFITYNITYNELGSKEARYYPMEKERVEKYISYANIYSKLLRETIGITIVFEPIDPDKVCTYPNAMTVNGKLPEVHCKRTINNIPVIAVVETPEIPRPNTVGLYYDITHIIYLENKDEPGTFLHELGHALTLDDIKEDKLRLLSEVHQALVNGSIMNYKSLKNCEARRISLGDFIALVSCAYRHSDVPVNQEVKEGLLRIGINPENATILLPVTPNGKLPLPVERIVKEGMLIIDWKNPENSKLNYDLVKVLETFVENSNN